MRQEMPSLSHGATTPRVLLVGGLGRLARHYIAAAKAAGWDLRYHEAGGLHSRGHRGVAPDLVIVIVPMVAHPLRASAARLAEQVGVPIMYLRQAGVDAVRAALTTTGVRR